MNSCALAGARLDAASRGGAARRKAPARRHRKVSPWLWRRAPLLGLALTPWLLHGQSYTVEAVSREVSIFNFGQPADSVEAISREVSLFNFGQPSASVEAISREVSLFNFGQPADSVEAISREVSLFNFGQPGTTVEAISREVSLFNFGQPVDSVEAISREVSVFNAGFYSLDAVSREVSVLNYGYNHFNLAVGSTVVLAGTSGSVPVTLSTLAPVTAVQVAVDFPQNLLGNWAVSNQPPLTATAVVSNNSRLFLTFSPTNGQSIANTQELGQITFTSASSQPSAFLPLPVAGATAPTLDGTTYTPYATLQNGEVAVLHSNSLLRAYRLADGTEYVKLYGFSGTNYAIQWATNLLPPVNWLTAYTLTPSDFIAVTPDLATTNPATFFRAVQ